MKKLWELFLTFLKIGTVTFGGGYAMIPSLRYETVAKHGWFTEEEMTDCIAICQSLPGALIINASIWVGKRVHGNTGAFAAVLGMVLPAFFSILLILVFLMRFQGNVYVTGALEGIKVVSVALILVTALQLARSMVKNVFGVVVALTAFLLIVFLEMNAVWAIAGSAAAGFLVSRFQTRGKRDKK